MYLREVLKTNLQLRHRNVGVCVGPLNIVCIIIVESS